jgi:succinate-semialdehyde dehydrogenase/glutarate-semialdehyde dehydrogenase
MSEGTTNEFIRNPATDAELTPRVRHDRADVEAATSSAAAAQPDWAGLKVRDRAKIFRSMSRYIVDHADELAGIVSECTGKPRVDALATEVMPGVIMSNFYARNAARFLAPRKLPRSSLLFFNKRSVLHYEPYGIVGIISPWNYPLGIPLHEVITGLLCGNAVLLKVATQAQPVGDAIARMLADCGLPEGLFHVLHLPGKIAGDALLDAGIDKLFFTGSTEVGRELAEKAGRRLVPVSLELGGNDGMVVLEDANIERAVWGAVWAGLSNAGQSCGGVERLFVVDSIYDTFVHRLREVVRSLRVGPDAEFDVDIGSLTTSSQLETTRRHIEEAIAEGARATAQSSQVSSATEDSDRSTRTDSARSRSEAGAGMFHPAVVLEDAPEGSAVMCHETFGPVLAVRAVADAAEGIARTNDSYLGLTASLWTADRRRARTLAAELEVGTVTINDHLMSHGMPETPWGGSKQSGIGRSHGELGFHEMIQPKVVVDERLPWMKKNIFWHPYSRDVYDGLTAGMTALYGKGFYRRPAAAVKLVWAFLSRGLGKDKAREVNTSSTG